MSSLLCLFVIIGLSTLQLTPSKVESLITSTPQNKVSFYEYRLQKNMFHRSAIAWFFTPELSYTKNKLNEQNALYSEGLSFNVSIFSPQRLSSLSESYFALRQNAISRKIERNSVFISVIEDLFDYEYTRQKLAYDSLNVKYAEKMLELSRERLSLGLSDSLDFLRAFDNLSNIKLSLFEDSVNLTVLKEKIKDFLGIQDNFTVVLDSFIPPDIDSLSPLESKNVLLNVELKKSALTGTYLALLSILPEVGFKYSWDYTGDIFQSNLDEFEYTKAFKVYLFINPLNVVFNINDALLRYKKAQWNLRKTIIQEKQKFREYSKMLHILNKRREVLENRAIIKERSFALALEKYSEGEISFQDVLKEQADYMALISEYLKVKLDIIKLRYNMWYNFGGSR